MKRATLTVFRRLQARFSTRAEPLTDVNIETTTYCNRRCLHCPNSVFERSLKKNARYMSAALFCKIVDDLSEMGFTGRISPHFYGEPLADARLHLLMRYAHTRLPLARLRIFTNGDLLTTSLLHQLCDVGVHSYLVTIQDRDPNAQAHSIKQITELVSYAEHHELDIELDYKTVDDIHLYNRGGLLVVNSQPPPPRCLDAGNPLAINYRGNVVLCCNDYLGEVVLGNLQHESLHEVWTKPEFVRLRRQLRRKVYSLDICKRCTGTS